MISDSVILHISVPNPLCSFQGHWGLHREASEETPVPHPRLRSQRRAGQRQAPHRASRNLKHRRVLGRRGQPRRQHPHPSRRGAGQEGLLRGPPSVRQLRPVHRHGGSGAHVFTERRRRGAHRLQQMNSLKAKCHYRNCIQFCLFQDLTDLPFSWGGGGDFYTWQMKS